MIKKSIKTEKGIIVELEMSGRQKFILAGRTVLNRLRFIAILAGVGLFIVYWDTIKLHWDRWTHPRAAAVRELPEGQEFFCPMDPQVHESGYEPNGDVPNCPICGMPLSLHGKPGKEELPPGVTGRVTLSPDRVQMAGIQTVAVGYRPMSSKSRRSDTSRSTRAGCRGSSAEWTAMSRSSTWTRPMRWSTRATRWRRSTARNCTARHESWFSPPKSKGQATSRPPRGKSWSCWASDPEDIDRMVAAGEPARDVVIRSPRTGHVIEKKIVARRERGCENDALRGGRSLHSLDRSRRLRK